MNDQTPAPNPEPVPLTVRQSGRVAVVSHVDAWVWRCEVCGWLGTGHLDEYAARKEGGAHLWNDHRTALCTPGVHGDGHVWRHVDGTDAISRCDRCGWEIGK